MCSKEELVPRNLVFSFEAKYTQMLNPLMFHNFEILEAAISSNEIAITINHTLSGT